MNAVHQFTAGFTTGDAISNEALVMRSVFRRWGAASNIFSEGSRVLPELRRDSIDVSEAASAIRPCDVALLHLSIGSVVNDAFAALRCRKAILYHNITPASFFRGLNEPVARSLEWGRRQAAELAGAASVVMVCSRFNAAELEALGYRGVGVLPLMLDFDRLLLEPDRRMLRRLGDGKANVLFVGRCVPNKRIEDVLEAFAFFQAGVRPDSRLVIAGSHAGMERYHAVLKARVRSLGLRDVVFAGALRQEELNAAYRSASLFLSMSEHEGFCIPLVESMCFGVPVLAFAATAVPETMDGAGVLFRDKRFPEIAEMMGRLASDQALRKAVLARQRGRFERYTAQDLEGSLRAQLAPLLD